MASKQDSVALLSLITGATIWGLVWYPYRALDNAGINGVVSSTATYAVAFVLGFVLLRRQLSTELSQLRFSWPLLFLAIAVSSLVGLKQR